MIKFPSSLIGDFNVVRENFSSEAFRLKDRLTNWRVSGREAGQLRPKPESERDRLLDGWVADGSCFRGRSNFFSSAFCWSILPR